MKSFEELISYRTYVKIFEYGTELFRQIRLVINISPMSEKFTLQGSKSIIIFSIFSKILKNLIHTFIQIWIYWLYMCVLSMIY